MGGGRRSPLDIPDVQGINPANDQPDSRETSDSAPLSLLAFKIMNDPFVGSLTFARIYSGTLTKGTYLNSVKDKKEKIGRMLLMHANSREDIDEARAYLDALGDVEAEAPGARPELVRSQAVTLAMLADLYADNNAPREACPLYAKVETILTGLEQRGLLSQLDRDSSLKMVQARQALPAGRGDWPRTAPE